VAKVEKAGLVTVRYRDRVSVGGKLVPLLLYQELDLDAYGITDEIQPGAWALFRPGKKTSNR
jgi:hypothetical protein